MIYAEKNLNCKIKVEGISEKINEKIIERHEIISHYWKGFIGQNVNHKLYAYTQTFKPESWLDNRSIREQHHRRISSIFRPLNQTCKFMIIPEVHKTGRKCGAIHYHGIINILDEYKFYNSALPFLRGHGHVTIKEIFDMQKWLKYLMKDIGCFLGLPISDYIYASDSGSTGHE